MPWPSSQRERWQCQDSNVYLLFLNKPSRRGIEAKWLEGRKGNGSRKEKKVEIRKVRGENRIINSMEVKERQHFKNLMLLPTGQER